MGKSKKITLSRRDRDALLNQKIQYEQGLAQALAVKNDPHKFFSQLVERIYDGKATQTDRQHYPVLHSLFATAKQESKSTAFKTLLLRVEKQHCYRLLAEERYLTGLYHVACFQSSFVRDVRLWKKTSHNPTKQFSSLLRHCFAQYALPLFLDSAWLPGGREVERRWYVDLGTGFPARRLSHLPIVLTKRMSHEFMGAPDDCTIPEALRWGQVLAMGGDANLAWYVNRSWLGRNHFGEDAFWSTFIGFFAGLDMFDNRHLEAVVDYVRHQRTIQPGFSMKGRAPEALLRQTEAWHVQLNRARNRGGALVWKASGIRAFSWEEGKEERRKEYAIQELLSSNELLAEGKAMQHCVSSYAGSCYAGKCAIFSLSVLPAGSEAERLVTIEVNLRSCQVVQAKRKYNAAPVPKEMQLIREWADQSRLTLSKWLS
ncbi:MAG: PcfJ domain-containing protein [Ferruginibacter sp.]|nr:PcfJ domain-containing protein [Cytophagales bacterium]